MDIVKPIPAKNPAPNIWLHELFSGKLDIFNWIKIHENKLIPTILPKNNPTIIPYPKLLNNPSTIPALKVMFVLASAKIGMIKKLTGR